MLPDGLEGGSGVGRDDLKGYDFLRIEDRARISFRSHVVFLRAVAMVLAQSALLKIEKQDSNTCFFAY